MNDLKNSSGFMCHLHPSATLAITAMAKEMKEQGHDVCSMCAGEPDFDTPQVLKDACISALEAGKVTYTPASGLPVLRKLIAEKFQKENHIACAWDEIVVAPGAKFSCFSAIAALCGPGDEVIIPAPYWLSYPEMVAAVGAKTVEIPTKMENNYELDPVALEAAITEHTRLLILNTPSNPTGAVYRRETLEKIAEIALRRNIMILSDEIYEKLTYDADKPHVSIGSLSEEVNANVITVNGFSKTYAMTGWRLGYLRAPRWLSQRIIAFQSHTTSNATTFAQYGAIAALEGKAEKEVKHMCKEFASRRDLIYRLVSAIDGVKCIRPQGAFYLLCDISSFGMPSEEFCNRLLAEEKLAVIPCQAFGTEGQIRLSYACSEANIRDAAKRLEAFCREQRN
ncbi:MAG: pyridoxal phosphate-dependent aminotransferase [Victivallales bacterium]|jgi:aspartate aminotransferase|nr:pyridoxal phosphate-dependent aminotransferase [Victivallales bacterium]